MIDKKLLEKIFTAMGAKIGERRLEPVHLLVGGAGAIVGTFEYPDSTTDVDAIPLSGENPQLEPIIKEIAQEFRLAPDWMNPHYKTFTIYLPEDYRSRLVVIHQDGNLLVQALGTEELLIMKFMAGRQKDRSHIKFLLAQNPDLAIVENRLSELAKIWKKEGSHAIDMFDEMTGDDD